jgi:DNA gyrase inhibitor GyrI
MKVQPLLKSMLLILTGVALVSFIAPQQAKAQYEQPTYTVQAHDGAIELRQYPPHVVVQVTTQGNREKAASQGFRALFGYISGDNTTQSTIAMTVPVTEKKAEGQKIAMTVPVTTEKTDAETESWVTRFNLPASFTEATAPQPINKAITLETLPQQRMAVIRFSGRPNNLALTKQEDRLKAYLDSKGLKATGVTQYAFYNGPFTLPMLRRNEVMIPVADASLAQP